MKNTQLITLLILLTLTFATYGQANKKTGKSHTDATKTNQLAGTWRIIEYADFDSVTAKWTHPYGDHPRGYFTYTEGGIVNLNISSENPLLITKDSAYRHSFILGELLHNYAVGYFGTYTIDYENSTVTHHPKGGAIPWYINTDQHRQFMLKGDTLFIGDPTFTIGKRVLIKEK